MIVSVDRLALVKILDKIQLRTSHFHFQLALRPIPVDCMHILKLGRRWLWLAERPKWFTPRSCYCTMQWVQSTSYSQRQLSYPLFLLLWSRSLHTERLGSVLMTNALTRATAIVLVSVSFNEYGASYWIAVICLWIRADLLISMQLVVSSQQLPF